MNTKKIILVFTALLLIVSACKNNTGKKDSTENPVEENIVAVENNINIEGSATYYGVLPAASCPGIHTFITLNEDGTFEKTTQYIGKEDAPETIKGNFLRSEESAKITLDGNLYLIAENKIIMLDNQGNEITGELAQNYILNKTILEPEPDANEGYTLEKFTGSDNNEYIIVFNTNTEVPTAILQNGDAKWMLMQTQAWAKGAEYEGSNAKLSVQGNKGTLVLGKEKITLKGKN